MTEKNIPNLRLIAQQIADPEFHSPQETVSWMGAMQAQDFNMAKWAIGLRLKGNTEEQIDAAINSAGIIRTHVLRPTWHFVSASDVHWMLDLTASRIKKSMEGRLKQLELDNKLLKKSNRIIEKKLEKCYYATRKELIAELNHAKIITNENRASHIFLNAELNKLICSGKMKGKEITYAFLEQRVDSPQKISRPESLAKLAAKYFQSHNPATLKDFVWWSGLTITDAKRGIEMIQNEFCCEKINGIDYWISKSAADFKKLKSGFFLLPSFDEFLIGYTDRSAAIETGHQSKAFSKNGIFWPTVIANGKVKGIWKRETKKDTVSITIQFFDSKQQPAKNTLKREAQKLGTFLNKKVKISYA